MQAERCAAAAMQAPLHNPEITYPRWYLHRWHFLPEGYLSQRSARGYEAIIRRVYNAGMERRVLRELVRELRRRAPERLLDAGCGPGHTLGAIARALPYAELTGIDLSPFNLERAAANLHAFQPRARLEHGDLTRLPHPAASFDAITSVHFIGHLPEEPAALAMDEFARVLAPGGRLYLVDHAWHPDRSGPFSVVRSRRLLGGLIRLSLLQFR